MTWEPRKLRWRKMHKGTIYTISCEALGVPPTKEESYQAANRWWRERSKAIPMIEPSVRLETYDFDTGEPSGEYIEYSRSEVDYHKSRQVEIKRKIHDLIHAKQLPEDTTLGWHVAQWLQRQRSKVDTKEITPGRYDNLRRAIEIFRDFNGSPTPIVSIDEKTVDDFFQHVYAHVIVKSKIDDGEPLTEGEKKIDPWSPEYAKATFGIMKTFIKSCYSRRLFEFPRNLDEHKIAISPNAIEPIAVEDFKRMFQQAKGQLKLHLLLMLNCGMRSTDISDLLDAEVDWQEGRIVRKRSKTRKHNAKRIPTVNYRLWDETFALLKLHRSGGEVVLRTKSGGLWCWEKMVDGKPKPRSSDNIATNYNRLRKSLKITSPLKAIRSRGASTLESHEYYGRYTIHYLGESPRSIKDKHYAEPSVDLFDTILNWLGKQFGFEAKR